MIDTETYTARDLRTVTCNPVTAYALGYDDAYYQCIYYNPYRAGTQAQREYEEGHGDGKSMRCLTANAGD